jgi:hypothetical protein
VRDEANQPRLHSTRTPDPARASSYSLSISYSGRMAVAVCLKAPLSAKLRTR